jgi:hypothetical protein
MSKFSLFFLATPPKNMKLKLHIHGGLLIANHLDQSLWSTNHKHWAAVRGNLLHSFWEVHNYVASFTSLGNLHEFGAHKQISWAKLAQFDFFAINLTVSSHILSTIGDGLRWLFVQMILIERWHPLDLWKLVSKTTLVLHAKCNLLDCANSQRFSLLTQGYISQLVVDHGNPQCH